MTDQSCAGSTLPFETVTEFGDRFRRRVWPKLRKELLLAEQDFPVELRIKGRRVTDQAAIEQMAALNRAVHDWRSFAEGFASPDALTVETRRVRSGALTVRPKTLVLHDRAALDHLLGIEASVAFDRLQNRIKRVAAVHDAIAPSSFARIEALANVDLSILLRLLETPVASGARAREVAVPGMDTKWIERHRDLLKALGSGHAEASDLSARGLWLRMSREDAQSLRQDYAPLARAPADFGDKPEQIERVLVVENRASFDALDPAPGTALVWGQGNAASSLLREFRWARQVELHYWGDCDSHGWAILSDIRRAFPQVTSHLMVLDTIQIHLPYTCEEPASARISNDLEGLTQEECVAHRWMRERGLRLEQERVDAAPLAERGLCRPMRRQLAA